MPIVSPSEWEPPPGLEVQRAMMELQKQTEVSRTQRALGQLLEPSAPPPPAKTGTQAKVGTRLNTYA